MDIKLSRFNIIQLDLMSNQTSMVNDRIDTAVVRSYLSKSIAELKWLIAAFSFVEGFLDGKNIVLYLIYNKIYQVPLFIYSIATSTFMVPVLLRMVYCVISDNFAMFNSRRRSYLSVISWLEVFLYVAAVLLVRSNQSYYIIFFIHFVLKITNTWRLGILCKFRSGAQCFVEGTE